MGKGFLCVLRKMSGGLPGKSLSGANFSVVRVYPVRQVRGRVSGKLPKVLREKREIEMGKIYEECKNEKDGYAF